MLSSTLEGPLRACRSCSCSPRVATARNCPNSRRTEPARRCRNPTRRWSRPSTSPRPSAGAKARSRQPAEGLSVAAFASGLDHPRWVYVLPNGDVLVAESNAPKRPEEGKGLKGIIFGSAQKRAGASVPSANRITLLRDRDGDGIPETRTVFIKDLNSPVGMALIGDNFYVANADAVLRFHYDEGATSLSGGEKVADLPGGPLNHHWVKNIIPSADGTKLYASVGSNSNVGENGLDKEENRAAILEIDLKSGQSRVFASGLRNPNGMAWQGDTLWTVVNERDELGSDLVPDYLTSVKDGGFYGWPFSYYGQHVDTRVKPPESRDGREGHRAGLRARQSHGVARAHVRQRHAVAGEISRGRVHRPARLVESQAAQRLQGDLRAVRERQAVRPAARRADRLPRRERARARAPGRRRDRQGRRAARGGRCRQHDLARDAGRSDRGERRTEDAMSEI